MKFRTLNLIAILIFSSVCLFAQDTAEKEQKDKTAELKAKAIGLLRETRNEVNALRTIENRISFTSELADLMWFYDAEQGKTMFLEVTTDFISILNRYNAEVMTYGGEDEENVSFMSGRSPTDKSRAFSRMQKALAVRQQIAIGIALHDAELGYDFMIQTSQLVTDANFKKLVESQDQQLETTIVAFMSEQDIDKALVFARKALKRKFNSSMLGLLEKVYEKDKDKGKSFASEILDKVKSEVRESDGGLQSAYSVLQFGDANIEKVKATPGKKPIFDESSLKDLAESFADALIRKKEFEESYMISSYYETINRFSPSSAKRLKNNYKDHFGGMDKTMDAKKDGDSKVGDGKFDGDPPEMSEKDKKAAELEENKRDFLEKLRKGETKDLPDEEKQKFIEEGQNIVSSFKDPTEKIAALSGLAIVVSQLGDKKLASELMNEASGLVTTQPRNYLDFMQVWTLASGYAVVEPEKAFPILDDAIYRLNDTVEAFVKVGEFIDVAEDIIIDNEVQLGSFGGSMTRSLVSTVNSSEGIIGNLARYDFDKTKTLANKFRRNEIRIMAKMLIMRSILDDSKSNISIESSPDSIGP